MHEAACVRRRQRPCDLLQRTAKHGEGAAAELAEVATRQIFHLDEQQAVDRMQAEKLHRLAGIEQGRMAELRLQPRPGARQREHAGPVQRLG